MSRMIDHQEFLDASEFITFAQDFTVYKTLLESTNAIPWKVDWATMSFAYIGPQIEALLGWTQESWQSVQDWATRMHPDDRDHAVGTCVAQSQAGLDHEIDYRALTKDNGYVWIRDVVHVVRDANGGVESLIGFMFDISERKRTEEELIALQKELQVLSFQDGLTGIANRRMFDQSLETEWKRFRCTNQPLSLIMLDLDHFKQFNDGYGHIKGDECLTIVAQTLKHAAGRPRDIVARYGGEEFVLILPETSQSAAFELADRCRRLIADLKIPHDCSSVGPFVTASFGVGTVQPSTDMEPKDLVEAVDRLLYASKTNGRNRVEVATL